MCSSLERQLNVDLLTPRQSPNQAQPRGLVWGPSGFAFVFMAFVASFAADLCSRLQEELLGMHCPAQKTLQISITHHLPHRPL